MTDMERNQEPMASVGDEPAGPSGVKMFMGSFSGVVIVGLIVVFIKPALEQAGESLSPAMAEAKAVVEKVGELRDMHVNSDPTFTFDVEDLAFEPGEEGIEWDTGGDSLEYDMAPDEPDFGEESR